MFKKFLLISMLLISVLHAQNYQYNVKYHGVTLGMIDDLSTIDKLYLKAKVTSRIARFMLGEDYLVYYVGEKPTVRDAKFKKDKKMILYAFAESVKAKPKFKRFKISAVKEITLQCDSKQSCHFKYLKNGKVNGYGDIRFDQNGDFVSITEKKSNFKIERR